MFKNMVLTMGALIVAFIGAAFTFWMLDVFYLADQLNSGYIGMWRAAHSFADFISSVDHCGDARDFEIRLSAAALLIMILIGPGYRAVTAWVSGTRLRSAGWMFLQDWVWPAFIAFAVVAILTTKGVLSPSLDYGCYHRNLDRDWWKSGPPAQTRSGRQ